MQLTTYTDYALRVLMHVALNQGGLVRIGEIAASFGISHNHLTKVVHNLGTAGYLTTVQGRNGGIRLGRPANKITVGEVVRAFEPDFRLVECFEPKTSDCRIRRACVLKDVFKDATDAFFEQLDTVTLAQLIAPRRRLETLLDIRPSPIAMRG